MASLKDVVGPDSGPIVSVSNSDRINTEAGRLVMKAFQEAQFSRSSTELILLDSLRQRRGVYSPDVLEQIRKDGGSEIYMQITQLKVRAAKAWISEVMLADPTKIPFHIIPSPLSDIPPEVSAEITARIIQEAADSINQGLYVTASEVAKRREMVYDQIQKQYSKFAGVRAARLEKYLRDILFECDFIDELAKFIDDFLTHPAAFMKGPFLTSKKSLKVRHQANGLMIPTITNKTIRNFRSVSPFDMYPSPTSRSTQDGYIIERMRLRASDFYELIGVKGYGDGALRRILLEYGDKGYRLWTHDDSSRNMLEGRPDSMSLHHDYIDTLNYWGKCRGQVLLDMGVSRELIEDPLREYEANIMMAGRHVFRAAINPNPLGVRPFVSASFEAANNTIWGKGIPQIIRDVQAMANAAARSMANNMGISSGPIGEVNVDRLAPGEDANDLRPWKLYQTNESRTGSSSRAINFFQVDSRSDELMNVFKFFSSLADEYTGIPPYVLGQNVTGGAASTASGLSLLFESSGRGIKFSVRTIDSVLSKLVTILANDVMLNDGVQEIMGDVSVKAYGLEGALLKETNKVRTTELLNSLKDPIILDVAGPMALIGTLRKLFDDLNIEDVLPSDDQIRSMMAARQQEAEHAQRQAIEGQSLESRVPAESPRELDAAGNVASGDGARIFG